MAEVAGVTEVTIRNRYKELAERLDIDIVLYGGAFLALAILALVGTVSLAGATRVRRRTTTPP